MSAAAAAYDDVVDRQASDRRSTRRLIVGVGVDARSNDDGHGSWLEMTPTTPTAAAATTTTPPSKTWKPRKSKDTNTGQHLHQHRDNIAATPGARSLYSDDFYSAAADDFDNVFKYSEYDARDDTANDNVHRYVDFIAPISDDPDTPAFTLRAILIATILASVLNAVNVVLTYRTNPFSVPPMLAVILAYPLGVVWSHLPRHRFFNPGKFTIKEHALIYIIVSAGNVQANINNMTQQAAPFFMDNQAVTLLQTLAFSVVSQLLSFSMAAFIRRIVVKPVSMWWPQTMVSMGLLMPFHDVVTAFSAPDSGRFRLSRLSFFCISFTAAAVYSFIPEFFAPVLQVVSLLCLFGPRNGQGPGVLGNSYQRPPATGDIIGVPNTKNWFASGITGVGIGALTFDWSYIGSFFLVAPFWIIMNVIVGNILLAWIVVPLLYSFDAFGSSKDLTADGLSIALNSFALFNGNSSSRGYGTPLHLIRLMNQTDFTLNADYFEAVRPIRFTPYLAITYFFLFATIASLVSHFLLFSGSDVRRELRAMYRQYFKSSDKDSRLKDVHNRLLEAYYDIPEYFFAIAVLVLSGMMILIGLYTEYRLPVWSVFLSLGMSLLFIVPVAAIGAISGITVSMQVLPEVIIGLIIPGQTVAVSVFKTVTTSNFSSVISCSELFKLGHYLKIAPWAVVVAQVYGTLLQIFVSVPTAWVVIKLPNFIQPHDNNSQWQAVVYQQFYVSGVIWGTLGSKNMFGPGTVYNPLLYGFLVGLLLPFLPWIANRYIHKHRIWHYICFPVLLGALGFGGFQNRIIVPLAIGILFQFHMFRNQNEWYEKYAYVLASALDSAIGIVGLVIAIMGLTGVSFSQFWHPLNPNSQLVPLDYYCYDQARYYDWSCAFYDQMGTNRTTTCWT